METESRAAFETVAIPLMKTLYNRALNLTRRPDVAADLVQQTYLRAFRTFANFQSGSNAKAWLLTILYSVFVSRYRKERREPDTISLDGIDLAAPDVALDRRALLDPMLWAGEEVNAALRRLPETFRLLLLMVDVDGMSYEEAAVALRCPIGTIRSRLSRARKILYDELIGYARARGFAGADS